MHSGQGPGEPVATRGGFGSGIRVVLFVGTTLVFLASLLGFSAATLPSPEFTLEVDVVQHGRILTYSIRFVNIGEGPAISAVLTDVIPSGSSYIGPDVVVDGVWTKRYGILSPGGYEEVVEVELPESASDGDRVVSVVRLEYTGVGLGPASRVYVVDYALSFESDIVPVATLPLTVWLVLAGAIPAFALSGGYVLYRRRGRPTFEQVFLMHKSGMLIHHWASTASGHQDTDILSGMLVIIKQFVRDSFREKPGVLTELQFGDSRMFFAEGRHSTLAAIASGKHVNGLPGQVAAAVRDFEKRHPIALPKWDGLLDTLPQAREVVEGLVNGRYGHPRIGG